ncbi:uncharacterized protein LOC135338761 [Halichondria panicea]|uniref:uncharacterized protein LOC135338761 n=1 Tax=Halichondria panicea TaxID=6063 RepID=UPI00312B771B
MLRVSLLVVVVLGCLLASSVCRAQVYYVKPSQPPNTNCPSKPCHTLNYYAQNATLLSGKSNVTLLFVEGVHLLTEPKFEIANTTNVALVGISIQAPNVSFSVGGQFNFTMIDELVISNLFFQYDSVNLSESACETKVSVSHIRRFSQNHIKSTRVCLTLEMTREFQLYNSFYNNGKIVYTNRTIINTHRLDLISMSIHHCSFVSSELSINLNSAINTTFNGTISSSHGVSIESVIASPGFTVYLTVNGCHKIGINIQLNSMISRFKLRVEGSKVESIILWSSQLQKNAVIRVSNSSIFDGVLDCENVTNVTLSQLSLNLSEIFLLTKYCRLENINVSSSPGMYIGGRSTVVIDGCIFENATDIRSSYSPLILSFVDLHFNGITIFRNNIGYRGGAMYFFNTKMYLTNQSKVIFQNNTAQDKGGAVYVQNPIDNELGTEINFPSVDMKRRHQCVFSLSYNLTDGERPNSSVIFKGNSAKNGGSDVYGTSLKSDCFVTPSAWQNFSYEVQSDIFKFDSNTHSKLSSVSSDPTRVCFCDENGRPKCASYSYIVQHRTLSPGEKFNVSLALVGGDFGVTGGPVHALLFSEQGKILSFNQSVKFFSGTVCSLLEYEVYSNNENSTVLLYFGSDVISIKKNKYNFSPNNVSIFKYHNHTEIDNILATTPVLLNITLQKCPLGLTLKRDTFSCHCVQRLTDYGITTCATVNGEGLITRNGTIWVSNSEAVDNETGVVAYKYCPFDYCTAEEVAVNLNKPNTQCAFNHSGILCGGCSPNLSLALGSPQCLPCSDNGHVAFFVPFAIAGLVLVLFIKLFDLTITKGAVNGLLLYANILWTNQSIFFPHAVRQSSSFFVTFVAWLNLDLGIKTCFIQGLDMYWKTWLQFLFPLYVWSLAGLIILACRYSDKATKLFGNNSVHVLATLFLLSYSKLLRTIITSLGFATLNYPGGTRVVWLADGNLPYFGVCHSFLFIAAIFALIIFLLPYTVTILLVPWLRKCGNISWINKLKPFFDAHYGPLKDKHQYWIGLTLLVRVILAVTNVAIQAIDPTINLLVTIALSSLLLSVVGFSYRKWCISILESSFVVNVIVLAGGFLYSSTISNEHFQNAFASVSVGIAFLTFLLIICVQGYTQVKTLYRCKTGVRREYENINGVNDSKTESIPLTYSVVSLHDDTTQDYFPLREELLESDRH